MNREERKDRRAKSRQQKKAEGREKMAEKRVRIQQRGKTPKRKFL